MSWTRSNQQLDPTVPNSRTAGRGHRRVASWGRSTSGPGAEYRSGRPVQGCRLCDDRPSPCFAAACGCLAATPGPPESRKKEKTRELTFNFGRSPGLSTSQKCAVENKVQHRRESMPHKKKKKRSTHVTKLNSLLANFDPNTP